MAEFQGDLIYRHRNQIVAALIAGMQQRIPDIQITPDSVFRLLSEVFAGELEGVYLANQLLHDDLFIDTATQPQLRRFGEMFGLPFKIGTQAEGTLQFTGGGGVTVTAGSQVAVDLGNDNFLYYATTETGVIPNPGSPDAPVATLDTVGGVVTPGLLEYVVTFLTATGETLPGATSNAVDVDATEFVQLTAIDIGGTGTTGRRIYRSTDGGDFFLIGEISDNTTTVFEDNVADVDLGGSPLIEPTAFRVLLPGLAEEPGEEYNVLIGTITTLTDVPDGVTQVRNTTVFSGGSDPESTEAFRNRLASYVQNPQSGSPTDLENWAMLIDGIETAKAFPNDNEGVPTAGHVTVRVSAPDGLEPEPEVIQEAQDFLDLQDVANITIHVIAFDQLVVNVTVSVTPEVGYELSDIEAAVEDAIRDYIISVPVNGTTYIAGIYDAVFGLPGVATLIVTVPAVDVEALETEKAVPGVITITETP